MASRLRGRNAVLANTHRPSGEVGDLVRNNNEHPLQPTSSRSSQYRDSIAVFRLKGVAILLNWQ